jgi:hypothetical protein
MVEHELPKLDTRVRFPLPAPFQSLPCTERADNQRSVWINPEWDDSWNRLLGYLGPFTFLDELPECLGTGQSFVFG